MNPLEGIRLEDIPQCATLHVVHNEIEVSAGLEST
jgi:hypothetical protein